MAKTDDSQLQDIYACDADRPGLLKSELTSAVVYSSAVENTSTMLTVKDLMKRLGVGRDSAYALMHAHGFPACKIGKRFFVSEEALDQWIKRIEAKEFVISKKW